MDRLPRDVASERLHHDIVRLLNDHKPRSPQMVSVIPNGPLLTTATSGNVLRRLKVVIFRALSDLKHTRLRDSGTESLVVPRISKPSHDYPAYGDRRETSEIKKET